MKNCYKILCFLITLLNIPAQAEDLPENLALNKPATSNRASLTGLDMGPGKAVDGDIKTRWRNGKFIYPLTLESTNITPRNKPDPTTRIPIQSNAVTSPTQTVAWRNGCLNVDTESAISRSDIVSTEPLRQGYQAMPLGNGRLTAMVWNEEGFTAQLNRVDTWPDLRSAGRLVIPELTPLETQSSSRLSLYEGTLVMNGEGLRATSRVLINRDVLIVEVTGADPEMEQTAEVRLWEQSPNHPNPTPRSPHIFASAGIAGLWETFQGLKNDTYGFVTAVSAKAQDVQAEVVSPTVARVRFRPEEDGTFRIVVAVSSFTGGDPAALAEDLIQPILSHPADLYAAHNHYWHDFWEASHLQLDSPGGEASYLENIRNLYFYLLRSSTDPEASIPASAGGGVGHFMYARDYRRWGANFWHFNTRLFTFANAAGNHLELTEPYRRYYLDHLDQWQAVAARWGKPGACPPEYTRYNGNGSGSGGGGFVSGIMSNAAEVSRTLWEQYQYNGDLDYLRSVYPFLCDAARFYLASLVEEVDGKLHVHDSAALEAWVHVDDDIPDLAGIRALFPIVIESSELLGEDADLRVQLADALERLTDFPRDPDRGDVIAPARPPYDRDPAGNHGAQSAEMELVFPFGLVGDDDQMTELMRQTFAVRRDTLNCDWSPDPIHAARLGLADEAANLAALSAERFQIYPSGLGNVFKNQKPSDNGSAYLEWSGTIAPAVQEMALQSYDGLIRVAPAWPQQWQGSFTLRAVDGFIVSSEVEHGIPRYVGIESLFGKTLRIRNPWSGEAVRLRTDAGQELLTTSDAVIKAPTTVNTSYVLERVSRPLSSFDFAPITGTANEGIKFIGRAQLGVGMVAPRADLAIADFDISSSQVSESTTRITVRVHNTGQVASDPTTVRLWNATVVPQPLGDIPIASIAPGGSVVATFDRNTTYLEGGAYKIRAVVNPDQEIVEADRKNNEAVNTINSGFPR